MFQAVVELIGRRWTPSVLLRLSQGPARFSDIASTVPGLSDRLLTERLQELETKGFIVRFLENKCIYYQFSELGREMIPSIEALVLFAHKAGPTLHPGDHPGRRTSV